MATLISTNKLISMEEALSKIEDGQVLMLGGFAGAGMANGIIEGLTRKGVKDLTLIGNDSGYIDKGQGPMVINKQCKKLIVSHVGTNPEAGKLIQAGELEVELVPQGTLIERIRAGGYGLGGILTPTGIGTEVEVGKQKIEVDGKEFLLEKPLKADIAIIYAQKADKLGNLVYHGSEKSHSPLMATAAELTIVEVDEVVEVGELNPDHIGTPSIFVDYIVQRGD